MSSRGQERVNAVIATHPERYHAVPVVAAGAGLRQGEVFGFRVEDVDFLGRRLHVRLQVKLLGGRPTIAPPKYGKERDVPLADIVAISLAERLRAHPFGEDGLIFTSREHKPMSRTYYNTHIWKPALVRAGVDPLERTGCTLCATTGPASYSTPGSQSGRSSTTLDTPILASPCASTPT